MKVKDLRFIVINDVRLDQGCFTEHGRLYHHLNVPCKISELPEEYQDLEVKYMFTFSNEVIIIQVEDALSDLPFSEEVPE